MKEIVRHFLPSVIRGVYRFDDAFSEVEDEEAFARLIESKLLFLPRNVPEEIRRAANLDENYTVAIRQLVLPGVNCLTLIPRWRGERGHSLGSILTLRRR